MNITALLLGILFLLTGALFQFPDTLSYIPAWRDTPEEEKKDIDDKALSRNAGVVIASAGLILTFCGLSAVLREKVFFWLMLLWMAGTALNLYWIGKKKPFHLATAKSSTQTRK